MTYSKSNTEKYTLIEDLDLDNEDNNQANKIKEKYIRNNSNISKYSELKEYDSITDFIPNNIDLLPNDFDYRLILIEQAKNSGHWTVLVRFKNNIYYFDSYGVKPDGEWKFIPDSVRKMLNQETNEQIYSFGLFDKVTCDIERINNKSNEIRLLSNINHQISIGYNCSFENYFKELNCLILHPNFQIH